MRFGGDVGRGLFETIYVAAQAQQAGTDGESVVGSPVFFVAADVTLQAFRGNIELALIRADMPRHRQLVERWRNRRARTVEWQRRRQHVRELRAVFGRREHDDSSRVSPGNGRHEQETNQDAEPLRRHAPTCAGEPGIAGASRVVIINCRSNASLRTLSS